MIQGNPARLNHAPVDGYKDQSAREVTDHVLLNVDDFVDYNRISLEELANDGRFLEESVISGDWHFVLEIYQILIEHINKSSWLWNYLQL